MQRDGRPSFRFIRPEVGDNGRYGGDEFITSGCKTDFCFEAGAGVKVVP